MGVPVVTLPGERHASRVSASLLHAAGFGELVAKDAADFARIAARCATDCAWGAEFRANARARMQASSLMDSKAYAARFFGALRESWRVRCAQAG
jgi:predicted O-linked N-acetylglucosamine transferase (SPINDLY family)